MAIDNCSFTFEQLANQRLPELMAEMSAAMLHPHDLAAFTRTGVGEKGILRELRLTADISGCYVLLKDGQPFYVGISRKVIKRLRQHVVGKTHFDASLAYRMASNEVGHELKRDEAMKDPKIVMAFAAAQAQLRGCQVAFIQIDNDLEIYLFEAYCSMRLDTSKWNTFRTH